MHINERIDTFIRLGEHLNSSNFEPVKRELAHQAYARNAWFTADNVYQALDAIGRMLTPDDLPEWAFRYPVSNVSPRTVGLIMAGNIPAVGFHDLLCVLMSGHRAMIKLSGQDIVLIQYLISKIIELNPAFAGRIQIAERLNAAEAYIGTGSDNTARYFEYYFASKPHIIRRNRTSVALLSGQETETELLGLGDDALTYFGLGCRNVSTLLVPEGFDFVRLLDTLEPRAEEFRSHHKFVNNYDYNKSIYLVNGVPHYDNGFLMLTENDGLVSPISVIYYHTYTDLSEAVQWISDRSAKIQVVVSRPELYSDAVPFGQAQSPGLTDYADGVDTMAFLSGLSA